MRSLVLAGALLEKLVKVTHALLAEARMGIEANPDSLVSLAAQKSRKEG